MKVISFYGNSPARSGVTLVSPRIQSGYRVKKVVANFALGCQNLLKLHCFSSPDNWAPADEVPTGLNYFSDYGQVDYVVGDNIQLRLDHEVEIPERGSYIKIYGENNDYYDHAVNVQVTIELIDRKDV